MKIILSIKPVYANKILNGEKRFELRKTIFKNNNIEKVMIYASSPISKIIGEFEIDEILHEDVEELWEMTKEESGVQKDFFETYFSNKDKGYAIAVKNVRQYSSFLDINEEFGIKAPQSFAYVK